MGMFFVLPLAPSLSSHSWPPYLPYPTWTSTSNSLISPSYDYFHTDFFLSLWVKATICILCLYTQRLNPVGRNHTTTKLDATAYSRIQSQGHNTIPWSFLLFFLVFLSHLLSEHRKLPPCSSSHYSIHKPHTFSRWQSFFLGGEWLRPSGMISFNFQPSLPTSTSSDMPTLNSCPPGSESAAPLLLLPTNQPFHFSRHPHALHLLLYPRVLLPQSYLLLKGFVLLLALSPQPVNILEALSSWNPSLNICPLYWVGQKVHLTAKPEQTFWPTWYLPSSLSPMLFIFPTASSTSSLSIHVSTHSNLASVSTKLRYIKWLGTSSLPNPMDTFHPLSYQNTQFLPSYNELEGKTIS